MKYLLIFISIFTFMYLAMSFMILEMDITEWDNFGRFGLVMFPTIITLMIFGFDTMDTHTEEL